MKYVPRPKSLLTGKENLEHLYTLKNFPVFMGCVDQPPEEDVKADMSFAICPETGMIQLEKLLPLDLVYQGQHNDGIGVVWRQHYEAFAKFLAKFSPKSVLDIGGGAGIIAQIYTESHPDVAWCIVEPNPILEETAQIKIKKGWFDEKFTLHSPVDTIVHSHVFEHTYQPIEFITQISQFLKEGDKHVFTFPNMIEQLSRNYTNCLNFEHTAFLAEPLVDYILQTNGFKIVEKEYFLDHSIFYATEKVATPATVPLPNHYAEYKELYLKFVQYHEELVRDLNEKSTTFEGEVYLFGAHIFSLYLLGFGLNPDKITSILDNSSLKKGKRLYGSPLTVHSPEILANKGAVAVILKVGIYRDEILKQLLEINPEVVVFE